MTFILIIILIIMMMMMMMMMMVRHKSGSVRASLQLQPLALSWLSHSLARFLVIIAIVIIVIVIAVIIFTIQIIFFLPGHQ